MILKTLILIQEKQLDLLKKKEKTTDSVKVITVFLAHNVISQKVFLGQTVILIETTVEKTLQTFLLVITIQEWDSLPILLVIVLMGSMTKMFITLQTLLK